MVTRKLKQEREEEERKSCEGRKNRKKLGQDRDVKKVCDKETEEGGIEDKEARVQ